MSSQEALLAVHKAIESLGYDDLWTLRDFLQNNYLGKKVRRHGLTPLNQIALTVQMKKILEQCASLSNDQLSLLFVHVSSLHQALAPIGSRRGGGGDIELKMIGRWKLVVSKGRLEVVRVYYGPYAYLRLWATGGDRDRKRKSLQSIYLGKAVAAILSRDDIDQDAVKKEIIAAYYDGTFWDVIRKFMTNESPDEDEESQGSRQVMGIIEGEQGKTIQSALESKQINAGVVINAFNKNSLDDLLNNLTNKEHNEE